MKVSIFSRWACDRCDRGAESGVAEGRPSLPAGWALLSASNPADTKALCPACRALLEKALAEPLPPPEAVGFEDA